MADWKDLIRGRLGQGGADLSQFNLPPEMLSGLGNLSSKVINDPYVKLANITSRTGSEADLAALNENLARAMIGFGEVPTGFSYAGMDPNIATMAQTATTSGVSTLAQIRRALEQAQLSVSDQLAARGMYRSGALPFELGNVANSAATAEFSARNELLDFANRARQAYLQAERQRKTGLAQALLDAQARIAQEENDRRMRSIQMAPYMFSEYG